MMFIQKFTFLGLLFACAYGARYCGGERVIRELNGKTPKENIINGLIKIGTIVKSNPGVFRVEGLSSYGFGESLSQELKSELVEVKPCKCNPNGRKIATLDPKKRNPSRKRCKGRFCSGWKKQKQMPPQVGGEEPGPNPESRLISSPLLPQNVRRAVAKKGPPKSDTSDPVKPIMPRLPRKLRKIKPTQPRKKIKPTQPRKKIKPTQPRKKIKPTQPRKKIKPTQPREKITPGLPRRKIKPTQPRKFRKIKPTKPRRVTPTNPRARPLNTWQAVKRRQFRRRGKPSKWIGMKIHKKEAELVEKLGTFEQNVKDGKFRLV